MEWLETALRVRQFPTYCVTDIEQALDRARTADVAAVLLEVDSPDIDVDRGIAAIRDASGNAKLPVFAMTGHTKAEGSCPTATETFRKPFTIDEIVAAMGSISAQQSAGDATDESSLTDSN